MSKHDDEMLRNYWAKLFGQAQVSLRGASETELQVQLFDVLEDFFDGSNLWQEPIQFTVVPNTQDYELKPLSGRIIRLLDVLDQNSSPQPAVMMNIGVVHFLYPYTETQTMTAIVIKTVTDPLTCFPPYIPDWIVPVYGRVFLAGLLGYMMQQPGQSYSNPKLAMFYDQKFRDGIASARVAMMKMNKVGAQGWIFPQQFRVTGQRGGVSTFNVHPSVR
jgi:hypothetical protein